MVGVLVISIDALKSDPAYEVHSVRVRFDEDGDGATQGGPPDSTAKDTHQVSEGALSTETILEASSSALDSVADLRVLLEAQLALP